jgi:UDP-N-acetylglucosamine diphosphorylase/glucosamine-1-phosphate N-acetyltransferase
VKLGAKIYGPTTVGPHSKVGGELNNVVIQGYSNKGHDGFLGNAVLGEWCNLGADTNNSNLKNNYATVKTWSYSKGGFKDTGLQFCGLAMGDHSKTGINTMLNTGTVIGVGCNVYGPGFPRTFIPSFVWGGAEGRMVHKLNKFFETASVVMERRNLQLSDVDKVMLSHIFEETEKYR